MKYEKNLLKLSEELSLENEVSFPNHEEEDLDDWELPEERGDDEENPT